VTVRVLVVEDSSAMRAFVRAALEEGSDGGESAEVTEAGSGFEALRLLPRESYDLVIVDINMPDINGLELVSFMRKTDPHKTTPVIIISTESSAKDRERGLALGANAFLSKPFGAEALRELVASTRRGAGGG
jgi:two-component system, chemotaxis family, chemotaxis protein CheY